MRKEEMKFINNFRIETTFNRAKQISIMSHVGITK